MLTINLVFFLKTCLLLLLPTEFPTSMDPVTTTTRRPDNMGNRFDRAAGGALMWKCRKNISNTSDQCSADCYSFVSANSNELYCDPPWEKLHRTCVRFMKSTFLNWQDARDSCISMNSNLLSITDQDKNTKIIPLVKKHVRSRDLMKWWVGIRQVESSWRWLAYDWKYAKIPEWGPGQGRITNTPRCGLLYFKNYLEDDECDTPKKPYICEQLKGFRHFTLTTEFPTSMYPATTRTQLVSTTTRRPDNMVSADSYEANCDPPWEKLHRTCVRFMKSTFLNWQDARDSCISMNSDLLSINDKEENTKIIPLVKKHVRSRDLMKWWVGIRQVESSWRWLDNDEKYAEIPEWGPGQGRITNTPRCGLLYFKNYLEDDECDTPKKPYICEQLKGFRHFTLTTEFPTSMYPATTRTQLVSTTTRRPDNMVSADYYEANCDPPWEKLHLTCVRFMKSTFLNWQDAHDSCISMNSDLLSINDKEENTKIIPLVKKHVRSRDLMKWWVGIRQVESSWRWLDYDEKYAKIPEWGPGQGRITNTPRCGLLYFKNYLEDDECDTTKKPYICEQFKDFGHFTLTTKFPTSMYPATTRTQLVSTTTRRPDNMGCEPDFINLTISDDLPMGDKSTKISFFCSNWGIKSVDFRFEITYDEKRYFSLQHIYDRNKSYLGVIINNRLKIKNWSTFLLVEERSKNITLNRVPFNITAIELNDRPTMATEYAYISIPESVPIGTIVYEVSVFDPDVGNWGQLELYREKDVPDEFELVESSDNTFEIRTRTALDVDKYHDEEYEFGDGPYRAITVRVRDGGGLTAVCFVNVTILDVGDNKPECENDTLDLETKLTRKDDEVTNLYRHCIGQNRNRAVLYHLARDNCTVFNISPSGSVVLQKEVSNIKCCNLTVKVSDIAFPNATTIFHLIIRFQLCPNDTDYMNIPWNTGKTRKFSFQNCPPGYNGQVTRYCNEDGVYQDPVYNCTKFSIDNIHKKLIDDIDKRSIDSEDIIDVLDTLTNATSETTDDDSALLIGDIETTIDTLTIISDVITVNSTRLNNITDSFIATVNNILDESTAKTWTVNINQTGSGADLVLKNTDRFIEKILTTDKNATAEISKSNLYLKIGSVKNCMDALNFPERESGGVSDWVASRQDELNIECDSSVESYSGIIYRNLSKLIPVTRNSTKSEDSLQLNTPVISFTLYPKDKRLAIPVEIKFQLYNNSWNNAKCSFWKESHSNTSHGYWSDEGCRHKVDDKNKDVVVCVCDHLTNFAVLMSPSSAPIDEDHLTALSIISLIGCVISLVCLILTVAIHAFFWRFIKSVRAIIHMNLSCALIVAYVLFLAGINRTENKDVCTAMAVLLHLAFLAVIFGMLTEGCNLSYIVLKPLSTRTPGIPLLIVSYVLAVIIVVISMGASQLQGYGTEKACWLSTDTGLIWAFLVPVFIVVLINVIIVVLVIRSMCNTTAMSKKSSKGRAKAALLCILILMPVMGLTWVFGALSVNEDTLIFQYIFAGLNSLQGLLIFIFHCLMNKKIKDAFIKQKSKWLHLQSFGLSEGKKLKTQDTSVL